MTLNKDQCTIGLRVQDAQGNEGSVVWKGRLEKSDSPPYGAATYVAIQFDKVHNGFKRTNGSWNSVQRVAAPEGSTEFVLPKHLRVALNAAFVAQVRKELGEAVAVLPDMQLVKFGIARNFEMKAVKEMITKHLQWCTKEQPTANLFFPETMAEDYPVGYGAGRDREGNLLYFERPGNAGKCHPKDFVRRYGLDTIAKWHIAAMETGKQLMRDSEFEAKRVTMIVDLLNLGDCGTTLISFAKTLAAIDQHNYPEHLAKLFVINAPSFFTAVWRLVKLVVDARTTEKIMILGKDQLGELTKYVAPENLPTFAGGSDTTWFTRGGRIGRLNASEAVAVVDAHPIMSPLANDNIEDVIREADALSSSPQRAEEVMATDEDQ